MVCVVGCFGENNYAKLVISVGNIIICVNSEGRDSKTTCLQVKTVYCNLFLLIASSPL